MQVHEHVDAAELLLEAAVQLAHRARLRGDVEALPAAAARQVRRRGLVVEVRVEVAVPEGRCCSTRPAAVAQLGCSAITADHGITFWRRGIAAPSGFRFGIATSVISSRISRRAHRAAADRGHQVDQPLVPGCSLPWIALCTGIA
jgi:hypothetical protein